MTLAWACLDEHDRSPKKHGHVLHQSTLFNLFFFAFLQHFDASEPAVKHLIKIHEFCQQIMIKICQNITKTRAQTQSNNSLPNHPTLEHCLSSSDYSRLKTRIVSHGIKKPF